MTELRISRIEEALPQFSIEKEIEEGNIKRVFEAIYDGRKVALKLINLEGGNGRLEGYTEREIEIMETIDSDHIVDLVDTWEDEIAGNRTIVIVEEFVPGDSLKQIIRSNEYSLHLGIRVANAILQLLPKFDSIDVVHRDIKPENLKISEEGVTLLDMGVARMNEKETLTPDYSRKGPGTVAYSAPEVLRNDRRSQDVRTDIFSTGIVFFEASTGEHPYRFRDMEILDAIQEQERKDFSGYLDDHELEQKIDSFYKRMTEYEPADRYRKPEHASEDLVEITNEVLG